LPKQTWDELRRLFIADWSLGKLAKRFDVPKGTLCARAAKERWSTERIEGQTLHNNQITLSDDPRLAEIQTLVRDCKLAALEAEARTAKALALKAAKAVETIEINSMDGITQTQTYRSNPLAKHLTLNQVKLGSRAAWGTTCCFRGNKEVRRTTQNAHYLCDF
jgi:hypothetical protein